MPLVMAHRGGFKPDNSLESFKKCLDLGTIPIIELDVSSCLILNLGVANQR